MADYDSPRPSSQPEGSTDLAVAKDNLITLDKVVNAAIGTEITNRKGDSLPPLSESTTGLESVFGQVVADNIVNTNSNTARITANETDIANLQDGQQAGVIVYQTKALLDASAPPTGNENASFKVTNDPTSSNNGYYSWDGAAFAKDADLVVNVIDKNNTSDAVSGAAVFAHVDDQLTVPFKTSADGLNERVIIGITDLLKTRQYDIEGDREWDAAGAKVVSAGVKAFNAIEVLPSTDYILSSCLLNSGVFLDESLVVITSITGFSGTYGAMRMTTPANCHYVKLNLPMDTSRIGEFFFKSDHIPGINLADGATFIKDKYLSNGSIGASGAYKYTENYIPVKGGKSYYRKTSAFFNGEYYDASRNYIGDLPNIAGNDYVFTMPASAVYARFSTSNYVDISVFNAVSDSVNELDGVTIPRLFVAEVLPDQITESEGLYKESILTDALFIDGKYLDATGAEAALDVYKYTEDYIQVLPLTSYGMGRLTRDYTLNALGVFYDAGKNVISGITGGGKTNPIFTTPDNCYFVRLNQWQDEKRGVFYPSDIIDYSSNNRLPWLQVNTSQLESNWSGRTIAWYGTSIAAGYPNQSDQDKYSYATRAMNVVGATPLNYGVPNGVIREFTSTGAAVGRPSFVADGEYITNMTDLMGVEGEPSLFIFDYGVNDYDVDQTDIDLFDVNDKYNINMPIDSRDTTTFIGSYNFVIDALLTADIKSKFAFITHYSDDSFNNALDWTNLNVVIESLAEYWGVPVLKMNRKTGWINRGGHNVVNAYCIDGIHPATDTTLEAVSILEQYSVKFLQNSVQ